MLAHKVELKKQREIFVVEPMSEEREDSWRKFKKKLKRRGKEAGTDVDFRCIPGNAGGGENGVVGQTLAEMQGPFYAKHLGESSPPRDRVHLADQLKQIWLWPVKKRVEMLAELIIKEDEEKYTEYMRCLEEGLKDSLLLYADQMN